MWYDQTPAEYAKCLRFNAERSDRAADVKLAECKPWSRGEAEHFRRQARRLRAMALIAEHSTEARAGDVDFRKLHDPTLRPEREAGVVAAVEAEFATEE